jgi:hypothetical protein
VCVDATKFYHRNFTFLLALAQGCIGVSGGLAPASNQATKPTPATCHGLGRLMQGINCPLSDTVACDRELSADIVPCRVSCDRVDGANSHVRAGGATEGPIQESPRGRQPRRSHQHDSLTQEKASWPPFFLPLPYSFSHRGRKHLDDEDARRNWPMESSIPPKVVLSFHPRKFDLFSFIC